MESLIIQRISSILDHNKVTKQNLANEINMNQTTLGRQLTGEQALSAKLIEVFLHVFPDISAEWLRRGEGEMYKSNSDSAHVEATITPSQDESIWKAKYEAIKECYDTLASNIGGISKRNVNVV